MPPDDRAQKAFALTTRTRTWYNETSNERDERSAPLNEDTRSILESIEDLRAEMNTGFSQLGSRLDSMGFRIEASRPDGLEKLLERLFDAVSRNGELLREIRAKQDAIALATKTNRFDIAALRGKAP